MYLKILLIIVNINKDENKSLISNQFSLKNDFPPPTHTSWRTILRGYKLKTIVLCNIFCHACVFPIFIKSRLL